MSEVRLVGSHHHAPGAKPASNPERFQVSHGPAAGEVSQVHVPPEEPGNLGHRLLLHGGTGATAVQGVVVGIDEHGERIRVTGDGMWGLQHLPQVEGVLIGVVVGEAGRSLQHDGAEGIEVNCGLERRE